ncbi:MAG TPA: cation diffusion facilitator family transporter [Bacteroidota bacterium]|nr:cation diffusion facilitator family transporter [Bacteroidota bacterium]
MAHRHGNGGAEVPLERNLLITMLLNFLITAVEIIGGIVSGSLSLLSDAIHNFSDGIAIIVSFIAIRLSRKPRTLKYTFGLKRAEILAAIINASTLIIISFFLIREAIERFSNPIPITGSLMLAVATVGFIANVVGTVLLKRGSDENMNIRAAYFHLLSDAFSSLAVIIGALFIMVLDITWIDPVLTILISLYILKETYDIVREAVDVLMMSSPAEIDMNELQRAVETISGVRNIHHVHLWRMNDTNIHFEAHIDVDDLPVSGTTALRTEIERCLHDRFDINHTTLQFECDSCRTKGLI